MKKNYIVLDIETTGLSRYKHGITEIAAVRFDGERVIDSFETLVHPERHIPKWIERMTWISNEMVADAPLFVDVYPQLLEFLSSDVMVAHNASFDTWFLTHHSQKNELHIFDNDVLCTRKLANRLVPELPRKNLASLCEHFCITQDTAHRAAADVQVTVELFQKFMWLMQEYWVQDPDAMLEFQSKNISFYSKIC